jgi:hypothetical protein
MRQFLTPPVFVADSEKTRVAALLNLMLHALLVTTVAGSAAMIWYEPAEIVFNGTTGIILTAAKSCSTGRPVSY